MAIATLLAGPLFSLVAKHRLGSRAEGITRLEVTSPLRALVTGEPIRLEADVEALWVEPGAGGGASGAIRDVQLHADRLDLGRLMLTDADLTRSGDRIQLLGLTTEGLRLPGAAVDLTPTAVEGKLVLVAPSGAPIDAVHVTADGGELQAVVVGGPLEGRSVAALSGDGPWQVTDLKAQPAPDGERGVLLDLQLARKT